MKKDNVYTQNGGPAFPDFNCNQLGMTLRDYFAAAAATGRSTQDDNADVIAEDSYAIADAMLKQREKSIS